MKFFKTTPGIHHQTVMKFCFVAKLPPMLQPIIRTVENDIEIIDDPMDDDYDLRTMSNRKASLQLKIVAHNNNAFR